MHSHTHTHTHRHKRKHTHLLHRHELQLREEGPGKNQRQECVERGAPVLAPATRVRGIARRHLSFLGQDGFGGRDWDVIARHLSTMNSAAAAHTAVHNNRANQPSSVSDDDPNKSAMVCACLRASWPRVGGREGHCV